MSQTKGSAKAFQYDRKTHHFDCVEERKMVGISGIYVLMEKEVLCLMRISMRFRIWYLFAEAIFFFV